MDRDSSKQTDQSIDRSIEERVDQAGAEESLSEALNGLEQILELRQARRPETEQPDVDPPQDMQDDAQYTIPLLHDVVVPGKDEAADPGTGRGDLESLEPGAEVAQACRKLTERLANEIEVIVQARIETAVQEAAEDIREQVRNHLEIMLPEIIEELNALGRRQGG